MSRYGLSVFTQHAALLEASAISEEVARARGYVSVDTKKRLENAGFERYQRAVPGMLIPLRRIDGSVWGYQYRPDKPRVTKAGTPIKYETPKGQRNGIDVPLGVKDAAGDPSVPLWVTEGSRKADAAVSTGLACVSLAGVWGWRGRNAKGGKLAVPDWHDIALNGRRVVLAFDSDVMQKRQVQTALTELAGYLASKGADVQYLHLPDSDNQKTGLDDYLAAHGVEGLLELVRPDLPAVQTSLPTTGKRDSNVSGKVPDRPPPERTPAELVTEGARVLDLVAGFIGQYIRFPSPHCLTAVALWAAHTWAAERFYVTPRLVLDSAEPESGKTRVLEVLNLACRKPEMILTPTTAAIFRMLHDEMLTLLFDEVDAIFNLKNAANYEDLRALLNAGYKRGATIPRCVGDAAKMQVHRFKVFAPVALAGLAGNMPATITTRSVTIHMRRRAPGEHVQPFYEEDAEEEARPIAEALGAWVQAIRDPLGKARPEMPPGVVDRPAEVWKALLAVADAAGEEWATRGREACEYFVLGSGAAMPLSLGIRLLEDLREIFTIRDAEGCVSGRRERMRTDDIISALVDLEDAPWADLRGKPIDARKLARELRKYDVLRKTYKDESNKSVRGYMVAGHEDGEGVSAGLGDAWKRYLKPQAEKDGNHGNPGNHAGRQVTDQMAVTDGSVTADPAVTTPTREVTEVTAVAEYSGAALKDGPVGTCQVCGTPMTIVTDGQTTHPGCEPPAPAGQRAGHHADRRDHPRRSPR